MRVHLAWTMLTEVLVTISGVFLLKVAAGLLGPVGFGEYAVSRRAVGLLYLPLLLGLGIAAPRYIAIVKAGSSENWSESSFVLATFTAGLIPVLAVALLLNIMPDTSALLLFGRSELSHLIAPASIALVGIALHTLVYSVYRGRGQMGLANLIQFVNVGLIPITVFGLAAPQAESVLLLTGAGWVIVSCAGLAHLLWQHRGEWPGSASLRHHLGILLRFGTPRIPGEFALVGLFAIPALIAVRTHGIVVAGQFSAAISVLTLASGAFAPVGLVILPRASAQAATGDLAGLRHLVVRIVGAGILLATAGVVIGELLIPWFVGWYFGAAFIPAIPVFRACLLGAIPYVAYVLLRSVLDAIDVRAVNSRNLIIALGVLTGLALVNSGIMWLSFSLVGSLTILGGLSLRDAYVRLRPMSPTAPAPVPL